MPRLGQQRRTGRITDELTSGTEAVTEARKPRGRVFAVIAGALVLCSGLVAVALAASTNFVEPATSPEPVGDAPFAVAAGDLDGDDDQDLAVANQNSDNVTILKNDGAGHFSRARLEPGGGRGRARARSLSAHSTATVSSTSRSRTRTATLTSPRR